MSENQQDVAIPGKHLDLGPEIVSCRRLSGAQSLRAQGFLFGGMLYYVGYPLIIIPYIAFINICLLVFLLATLSGQSFEMMFHKIGGAIIGIAFLLFYGALCWFAYIWPRRDHLVLHEKGLRIRLGFKRLRSLFESIQGVFVGRAPSKAESVLRKVIGSLNPGQAEWLMHLDGTALAVVLEDGSARTFKALLTHFDPADLERFFYELVRRNPRLGDNQS